MSENTLTATTATADRGRSSSGRREHAGGSKKLTVGIIACAAVMVVGIAGWVVQLTGGMSQTGMRNLDSWGLYLTCFMFFVGLSAGGLIISSIPHAFGMKGFGPISKIAIWSSICCVVAAIGFVVVDLGGPWRLWELFVYSNFTSPLMWDILVLGTYLVLSCIYLWATMREERGLLSHTAMRVLSIIALCVAISVHTVTAWIFALAPTHEFWHTALMGPWFVASALDCGTALVLIVVIALGRAGYLDIDKVSIANLAKMLGVFVCVDLYFFACDLLTSGYFGGEGTEVVAMLITGPLAPFFWCQIIMMAVSLVILFWPKLRTRTGIVVASALVIAAVFCKRCQIMVGGFQIGNIELPGVMTQYTVTNGSQDLASAYANLIYWPAPIEFVVTFGVVALAGFLLLAGIKMLNLMPAEQGE